VSWIGKKEDVTSFLLSVGADRSVEHGFKLTKGSIVFGIGGDEAVIPGHIEYFIDGNNHPLAVGLIAWGRGVSITTY